MRFTFLTIFLLSLFIMNGYSQYPSSPDEIGLKGAGVSYDDLTVVSNPGRVRLKAGVYEYMDWQNAYITVDEPGVIIRKSRLLWNGEGYVAIKCTNPNANLIIEDCEIDGQGNSSSNGIAYTGYSLIRTWVHNLGSDGLKANGAVTVYRSWIGPLNPLGEDPHCDVVQVLKNEGGPIIFSSSVFEGHLEPGNPYYEEWNGNTNVNCLRFSSEQGTVDDVIITGNHFMGSGFQISFATAQENTYLVENNMFDTDYNHGYYYPTGTPENISWSNNMNSDGNAVKLIGTTETNVTIGTVPEISYPYYVETNDYTTTINDFSRDRTLFDSDMARGNNNAEVGLSGTSDAPDGSSVEARAVSTDDSGSTSTDWQTIAKVSGGKWTGTLNTPRSSSWYKAEARVKGSTKDPAQTSNRFGVGLIILHSGQSNYQRVSVIDGDATPVTIGNNGDNFQMWQIENRGAVSASDENSTIGGPYFITDSKPRTDALRAMAALYHKNAPGLKVMALFDVKSGVAQEATLKDSDNRRKWESIQKLFGLGEYTGTGPMADGQYLGIFIQGHLNNIVDELMADWYAATCLGKHLDGSDIPGVSHTVAFPTTNVFAQVGNSWNDLNINHLWTEAMPGLRTGRTQVQLKEPGATYATTNYPTGYDLRRQGREELANTLSQHFHWANDYPFLKRFRPDGTDGNHFDIDNIYGAPLKGQSLAVSVLREIGATPFDIPRFDIISKTDEYIELGSSAGPVTTMARAQNDFTNFTTEVDVIGEAGQAEVLGFQYADFKQPTRVEIVDENGNSAAQGNIRVYLDPGYTKLYYAMGAAGIPSSSPEVNNALFMRHYPIVDVGIKGGLIEHGVWVEPYTDREFINQGIPDDAVTGVDLLSATINLQVDETSTLAYSISPTNASNKTISWTSGNISVATVDANGLVSAVSVGQAIITVTTNDGGFTDQCTVNVSPSGTTPSNVTLNKPITVSNEHLPDDPKEEFVDGDAVSYWAASGFPQWAEIDLQGTFDLSSVELVTHQDRDYQYIVEAKSTDGTYTTIVDRSANAEGKNLVDAVAITATHVKITVTGAKTYTGTWVSLKELIVMGLPGSGPGPASQQSAYASNALPGRIQVEDYDNGGEGIAFHDVDEKKLDLTIRPDDNVDMEATTDVDGEYNTGWMSNGEWLEYTLTDVAAGIYTISVRASSDKSNPGDVVIKLGDGPEGENFVTIATVPISGTGGWEKWQTFTANDISIDAGTNKVLRLQFDEAGYDMNWVDFSAELIPSEITLDKEMAQIVVGESLQLTETVSPSGAADKTIIWTTSDATVATVDANGVVSALSTGQTTITATTNTGNLSATCEITVVLDIIAVDGISISNETLELNIGASSEISVTITPEDASDKSVTWSSSDENIATVDANGVVSALSGGLAIVTVTTSDGGFTASCKVTVAPNIIAVESISISHTTAELTIDSTISLSVKIAPENASDKSVSWTSSNPDIATVDENGLVTAIAEGSATIRATTRSGSFESECQVEVSLPNGNIGINDLSQNSMAMAIYPNPNSTGILHIDLPKGNKAQNTTIKIYDLTGKTILAQNCQGKSIEIDLSCKRGIYVIEVSMPTTTNYRKLVVR